MSRRRTKDRNRRRRLGELRAEFEAKRRDPEALVAFLRRHADSERRLWAIADPPAGAEPLDEAERAMIAQLVAPHLAGMSSARRRHEISGMDAPTAWKTALRSRVIDPRMATGR
jgi:hypothetical protein